MKRIDWPVEYAEMSRSKQILCRIIMKNNRLRIDKIRHKVARYLTKLTSKFLLGLLWISLCGNGQIHTFYYKKRICLCCCCRIFRGNKFYTKLRSSKNPSGRSWLVYAQRKQRDVVHPLEGDDMLTCGVLWAI